MIVKIKLTKNITGVLRFETSINTNKIPEVYNADGSYISGLSIEFIKDKIQSYINTASIGELYIMEDGIDCILEEDINYEVIKDYL